MIEKENKQSKSTRVRARLRDEEYGQSSHGAAAPSYTSELNTS
jgi:hypothetical protein